MKSLWIFGCSFSANNDLYLSHLKDGENFSNMKIYYDFHNKTLPDTWSTLLSEKLNLDEKNYAMGGISNQEIFHRFCKQMDSFEKGDLIILEWTMITRFRLAWGDNHWDHILPNNECQDPNINKQTTDEISFNRLYKIYEEEIYDYIKVINTISEHKNTKVYFWTIDKRLIYNVLERPDNILMKDIVPINEEPSLVVNNFEGCMTISQEVKELYPNYSNNHFGKNSNIKISDLFYEQIKKDLVD